MNDDIWTHVKKNRLIVELRYKHNTEIFDNRSRLLNKLRERFGWEHWSVTGSSVRISDDPQVAHKEIGVTYINTVIAYDQAMPKDKMIEQSKDALKIIQEILPSTHTEAKRLGVRAYTIFTSPRCHNFGKGMQLVQDKFLGKDLPFSEDIADVRMILNYKTGALEVGPVQLGELWLKQNFNYPNEDIPDHGLGLSADNWVIEFSNDHNAIQDAVTKVYNKTLNMQEKIINSFL